MNRKLTGSTIKLLFIFDLLKTRFSNFLFKLAKYVKKKNLLETVLKFSSLGLLCHKTLKSDLNTTFDIIKKLNGSKVEQKLSYSDLF